MKKIISISEAIGKIHSGQRIMLGGFGDTGVALKLIEALGESDIDGITTISNDGGRPDETKGRFMCSGKVSRMIVTFIGLNPGVSDLYNEGKIDITFVPQGTFVEAVRAAGFGLGGVLTKVGIGTKIAENHKLMEIGGETYMLQEPIQGDVALLYGETVDQFGNVYSQYCEHNYQLYMAMAAKRTIVEAKNIVKYGELDVNTISIPGVFVDHIVQRVN